MRVGRGDRVLAEVRVIFDFFIMYSFLDGAMTPSMFIIQPYTLDHFRLFGEGVVVTYTRNICTQWSTGFSTSTDLVLIFLDEIYC